MMRSKVSKIQCQGQSHQTRIRKAQSTKGFPLELLVFQDQSIGHLLSCRNTSWRCRMSTSPWDDSDPQVSENNKDEIHKAFDQTCEFIEKNGSVKPWGLSSINDSSDRLMVFSMQRRFLSGPSSDPSLLSPVLGSPRFTPRGLYFALCSRTNWSWEQQFCSIRVLEKEVEVEVLQEVHTTKSRRQQRNMTGVQLERVQPLTLITTVNGDSTNSGKNHKS